MQNNSSRTQVTVYVEPNGFGEAAALRLAKSFRGKLRHAWRQRPGRPDALYFDFSPAGAQGFVAALPSSGVLLDRWVRPW